MRIALYHNGIAGGSKRHLYEMAKQMKKEGHILGFFRPSTECGSFLPIQDFVNVDKIYPNEPYQRLNGRLPLARKYVDLIKLKLYLEHMKKLSRKIAADIDATGFDFVLLFHCRPVQSPYLLRYLKTRCVYFCHEPMRSLFEPKPAKRSQGWYGPADSIWEQLLKSEAIENAKSASLLLTNSDYSAEYIHKAYGVSARVSYLGVDENVFRPQQIQKEPAVLTVGRLSALKGQDFLIQALGLIPEKLRPSFYIAADSCGENSRNDLSALAASHKVKIKFFINIPDEELVSLYNRVQAFVYAPVMEPFGLVLLEAMACGTPVIGVRGGGAREFLKDGINSFVRDKDIKAFAQAVEFVLKNKVIAEKAGRQARSEVLEFWTWKHAYRRMMECISYT